MKLETRVWTLDELILANKVKLGRGDIISKKDIASFPGEFPIYSSAREKNGTFGFYGKYMFDEELITWSIDGGGRLFYRPRHKFSVTNVGGTLRILDADFLDCRYLHLVLTHLHSKIVFDWVRKAHPSVIRMVYNEIPIPSLEKQHEIVEMLNRAFIEIDTLERNLEFIEENASELLQSVLNFHFSSGDQISGLDHSSAMPGNVMKLERLTSIQTGKIDVNKAVEGGKYPFFTCSRDVYEINDAPFEGKAVLVAGNGDLNVKYYEGKFNAYQRTYFLFVNDENELIPKYLYWFLESYVDQLRSESIGSTIKYIKMGNLTNAEIPLPSLGKQLEIVEKLDSAFAEIERLKAQIKFEKDYAVALRQSILNSAFTQGKVVA